MLRTNTAVAAPLPCPSCSGSGTQTEYRGPWSRDYRCEDCDGGGALMLTADTITDEQIRALRDESRAVGDQERVRCCNAALGIPVGDGALGLLDARTCRTRVAAILENARQCGTLEEVYGLSSLYCEKAPPGIGHVLAPLDPQCLRCGMSLDAINAIGAKEPR